MGRRGQRAQRQIALDLFEYCAEQFGLVPEVVVEGTPGADAWERLTAGLHGFLESALEPEVQRVMLLDGPVVLGWQTLRSIEERNSIALINEMVGEAIAEGIIDDQPVGELTHMVIAALEEASLLVAHAADPSKARRRAAKVLDRLLLSFAAEPRKVLRR